MLRKCTVQCVFDKQVWFEYVYGFFNSGRGRSLKCNVHLPLARNKISVAQGWSFPEACKGMAYTTTWL